MRLRVESSGYRVKEIKNCVSLLLYAVNYLVLILLLIMLYTSPLNASIITFATDEKWSGVDESVVEKYAKEHGREAREPFINTDQGDLLLFVFLIAGVAGGFMAGYYWKVLLEKREKQ